VKTAGSGGYSRRITIPSRKLVVIVTVQITSFTTCTLIHYCSGDSDKAGMITTIAAYVGDKSIETGLHILAGRYRRC
jgi:hypothetical protein